MFKKILITGATGFLGEYIVYDLLKKNYSLLATGRNEKKLSQFSSLRNIETNAADLSNHSDVEALIKECDAVIHCAALAAPWGKKQDFYTSNVLCTRYLCELAFKYKIKRFVHISTPSLYMGMTKTLDISETDALSDTMISEYAKTKKMGEDIVDDYFRKGLPVITLRPQALFGPKDPTIIPRIIAINEKIGIPLIGSGNHKIDLTYVENVVHAAYLALIADEKFCGKKYNITNNAPVEFKKFLEDLFVKLEITPKFKKFPYPLIKSIAWSLEKIYLLLGIRAEPPVTQYAVDVLSKSRTLSIQNAQKDLGYQPIVSLEEGTQRYADWWKSQ